MGHRTISLPDIDCKYPEKMVVEFGHLTLRTQSIVIFVNYFMIENLAVRPVWTSFIRRGGIHGRRRAADMSRRVRDMKYSARERVLMKKEIDVILKMVNELYPYGKGHDGKKHKAAIYHKTSSGALHIHFQSPK